MTKQYIAISLIILTLLTGCGSATQGDPLNNGDSTSGEVSDNFTDISYSNSLYGFKINFPSKDWFLYKATNRQLELGELGVADSVDFGLDKADSLFNIAIYTTEQWAAIQAGAEAKPTLLAETDEYVYAYTLAQEDFGMKKRFAEVPGILSTFSLQ